MPATPVIAIFDIGKSNKKLLCFDQEYRIVFEHSQRLEESMDEDGYPCEDLERLNHFVVGSFYRLFARTDLDIRAINFSAYGASLVCLDKKGAPLTPLYSYLKPYPDELLNRFYSAFGGKKNLLLQTASPSLGSLNSGLQIYRIRYQHPDQFHRISRILHLPHYLSWLFTGKAYSGFTSIGCHTHLWNFRFGDYHEWVEKLNIKNKLAKIFPETHSFPIAFKDKILLAGIGVHDSSAALIPYLMTFREPFILLTTGTWSISLNPFNTDPLTLAELEQDCLCYLRVDGLPVKASRFFLGPEFEERVKRIAAHFLQEPLGISDIKFDPALLPPIEDNGLTPNVQLDPLKSSSAKAAYHLLVWNLVSQQKISTQLVVGSGGVRQIYVDGGFSKNLVFMHLLARAFPQMEVYAAVTGQAAALGAAIAIHAGWNPLSLTGQWFELTRFNP